MLPTLPFSALNLAVAAALMLSGIAPFDRPTWGMEVFPVLAGLPLLLATRRRFPLTDLLYLLIFLHALILIYGGAYTYARVPFGYWLQACLELQRNPYDKIGHFAQGLVPALLAREILLRGGYLRSTAMAGFLSLCVAMAVSATYELVEWAAAVLLGQGADDFLGTQGDAWDTQSDMAFALFGATVTWSCLAPLHDRRMAALQRSLHPSGPASGNPD